MGIFNRLLVAVLALGTLAAAVAAFLVAAEMAGPTDLAPGGWLRDQLREIDGLGGGDQAAALGFAGAAAVASLVLLVLEPLPLFRVERVFVADAAGTDFGIYGDSIKVLIERTGREIKGVTGVTSSFRRKPEGLKISCRVRLAPSTNMPEVSSQLQEKIKAAVEGMAGVNVAEVKLKLRYGISTRGPRVS